MKYAGMPAGMWLLFARSFRRSLVANCGVDAVRAGEIVYDGPSSQVTQDVLNQVYNGQTVPTTENDTKTRKADDAERAGKKEKRA